MAQDGGKVVSLTRRPLFAPRKYSWYSFLFEAESTPGPQCDRKNYVNDTIWNRTMDLTICSTAPLCYRGPRPIILRHLISCKCKAWIKNEEVFDQGVAQTSFELETSLINVESVMDVLTCWGRLRCTFIRCCVLIVRIADSVTEHGITRLKQMTGICINKRNIIRLPLWPLINQFNMLED